MATYNNNTTIKIEGTTVTLQGTLGVPGFPGGSVSYVVPALKMLKATGFCFSGLGGTTDEDAEITVNGKLVLKARSRQNLSGISPESISGQIIAGPGSTVVCKGSGASFAGVLFQNTP